ncbi:MAG: acetyl-CoA acetyltransferase, partial [Deltaproteobacteria bacterium]
MNSDNVPIIVGAAQITQRWSDDGPHLDALGLMEQVARAAIADTGARGCQETIDTLAVINTITWSYRDAPGELSRRLGINPQQRLYTAIGGNMPQMLVNRYAARLEAGHASMVLLCGAEAGYSARRVASGLDLGWPPFTEPERIDGDMRLGSSDYEIRYELTLPTFIYPFFETALRASSGRRPDEHAAFLGRLCSRMSRVAASHPNAWSREELTAEEIATVTPDNRLVGYPYTKRMNANISVDQGAALLLTTVGQARRLGIDEERWVYPMGGADLFDVWEFTRRPRLDESPAIRRAVQLALAQAGLELPAIDWFDFYSCFPCAVQIGARMAGLDIDDPRGPTLTGGLPYFGGPGNNYSMHAIATAVDKIRKQPDGHAMITALGWYITKHSVGVYGRRPPAVAWNERDSGGAQAEIDAASLPPPLEQCDGRLTVDAFMIRHRRSG